MATASSTGRCHMLRPKMSPVAPASMAVRALLRVRLRIPAPWTGIGTANSITSDLTATAGTIDHVVVYLDDGTTNIMECTVSVAGGGGEFIVSPGLVIQEGDAVAVTELTITQPES